MKPAVTAVLLACLHGSAIAAPFDRGIAQDHVVHQRDTTDGGSDGFLAEREGVDDALRQLAENPVIKRQIDGLLANKDIMTRIALAIAASQQLSKRDASQQLDRCTVGDLFLNSLGGLAGLGSLALGGGAEGVGSLVVCNIVSSGGVDADLTGGILGGDPGPDSIDLGGLAGELDLTVDADGGGGLDLDLEEMSGGLLGDNDDLDPDSLGSFLGGGLSGGLAGGLSGGPDVDRFTGGLLSGDAQSGFSLDGLINGFRNGDGRLELNADGLTGGLLGGEGSADFDLSNLISGVFRRGAQAAADAASTAVDIFTTGLGSVTGGNNIGDIDLADLGDDDDSSQSRSSNEASSSNSA